MKTIRTGKILTVCPRRSIEIMSSKANGIEPIFNTYYLRRTKNQEETVPTEKIFILWDNKDGSPKLDDSGLIGRVGENNCYIALYPKVLGDKFVSSLDVGEHVMAEYSLSGTNGVYVK